MITPLSGKTVLFLGSSVTYGACSGGYSFVEALAERTGLIPVKEAVSGTTLADVDDASYIARMLRLPDKLRPDLFLCQLSTNDATRALPLGAISPGRSLADFDPRTVTGALETIIVHAMTAWRCPVLFYTGTRYDSPAYERMVERLLALGEKWPIAILDLWHDPAMLAVSPEDYARYMHDPIHPTREGYVSWWTPRFEAFLTRHVQ